MVSLKERRAQRNNALNVKHILPLEEKLQSLKAIPKEELRDIKISYEDAITLEIPHISTQSFVLITAVAKALIPWRKGPFRINDLEILSEWDSAIKYNLLLPYLNLHSKVIGDIGCNNGYYLFRMCAQNPKCIVGFDPMPLCFLQYKFLQFFIKEKRVDFELLGIEELIFFENSFDMLFCLGVLYHRKSPLDAIKLVYNALKSGGEAIFDNLIIDGTEEIALFPKGRYAKMPNVYFIPTLCTFKNWLMSCGFKDIVQIAVLKTTTKEQRKTCWSSGESLEDFLDPTGEKTIEGYPAPKRAYLKAKKA